MTALEHRVRGVLSELDMQGLRRTLRPPTGIDLSSNDYLGLSAHPVVRERMARAVCAEGAGSTGSRLLRGDRESFAAIERRFAKFKETDSALYFSSGYLANIGVLATLPEAGDVIFSDQRNHASLIDGTRLSRARRVIFPHNDVAALSQLMRAEPGQKFVVVESLFSMDGDFAPLAEYAELCRNHQAVLIVDEAHAVGIYGQRGSGLIEAAGLSKEAFLSINTAGKALGVSGAFVCGPEWAIEYLVQRARPFIFSTAAPPAVAAAIDASLDVISSEPERRHRLLALSTYLMWRRLKPAASALVPTQGEACPSPIIPIILVENSRALTIANSLQAEGYDVRAIRPPSVPAGTARLRLTVNVNLTEAILDNFATHLEKALCAASS